MKETLCEHRQCQLYTLDEDCNIQCPLSEESEEIKWLKMHAKEFKLLLSTEEMKSWLF